jgi:hypothetical protein
MPFTYQSVVDLARIPLNDTDQARYPDSTLLLFLNHGMLQILKRRPDLFIGRFQTPPEGQNALEDTFPLPGEYAQTVADYVTARAELTDDEHVNSGRAVVFMQLFSAEAQS